MGTWINLLPGYQGAVAATRLVGADPWVLGGVIGALGAAFLPGYWGTVIATCLLVSDL